MIIIREAESSDAKCLSVFAESCFRDAFSAQNSTEDINIYCCEVFSEEVQKNEISSDNIITLLVEADAQLVAYAQLFFDKAPDCVATNNSGEIRRFYVDRSCHGQGIAQRLMAECFKVLEKHNVDVVWLAVWEKNIKAITFYKKCNFQKVGEQMFLLGKNQQRDILMAHRINQGQ